jgi:hypothetical protein
MDYQGYHAAATHSHSMRSDGIPLEKINMKWDTTNTKTSPSGDTGEFGLHLDSREAFFGSPIALEISHKLMKKGRLEVGGQGRNRYPYGH